MTYAATITSKRQLTIPAKLFRELGLEEGQKVALARDEDDNIKIIDMKKLVNRLAGSVSVPDRLKDRDIDELIKEAIRTEYSQ